MKSKGKYIIAVVGILGILGILAAVLWRDRETEYGDTYVEGVDSQYLYQYGMVQANSGIQRGNGVVYVAVGDFLYYMDEKTHTILPLCNRVDCMHDKEETEEKRKECMAYMEDGMGLSYNDGWLYYTYWGTDYENTASIGAEKSVLYRIRDDGSKKEMITEWKEGGLPEWLIHRGCIYYIKQTYEIMDKDADTMDSQTADEEDLLDYQSMTEEEELADYQFMEEKVRTIHQVMYVDLNDPLKTEHLIYQSEEGKTMFGASFLRAYGNHVYFNVTYVTEDDYQSENRLYTYDIQTEELTLLGNSMHVIGFQKDQLLYLGGNGEEGTSLYRSGLRGENPEILCPDIPEGVQVMSDDKYIYKSNLLFAMLGFIDEEPYQVKCDSEGKELMQFSYPIYTMMDPMLGSSDCMYYKEENEKGFTVMHWDKETVDAEGVAVFQEYRYEY